MRRSKKWKKTDGLSVFFALIGSGRMQAGHKMLVKLTPDEKGKNFWVLQMHYIFFQHLRMLIWHFGKPRLFKFSTIIQRTVIFAFNTIFNKFFNGLKCISTSYFCVRFPHLINQQKNCNMETAFKNTMWQCSVFVANLFDGRKTFGNFVCAIFYYWRLHMLLTLSLPPEVGLRASDLRLRPSRYISRLKSPPERGIISFPGLRNKKISKLGEIT